MANVIRIKRSASTNQPASLAQGELANAETGTPNGINELFIGAAGPTVFKVVRNLNGAPAEPTAGLAAATMVAADYLVFEDATDSQGKRQLASAVNLSIFNNDSSWTSNAGTVTSVGAGNGMDFTAITGSGNVVLGTPGTLTAATTNAVTATSHTHDITTTGTGNIMASNGATLTGQFNAADNVISRPELTDYGVTHHAPTVSSNAVTVDLQNGNSQLIDMDPATAQVTLTLSNPPASGTYGEVSLVIVMGTPAYGITWPGSVTWMNGGNAPTLSTVNNDADLIHLFTVDGGTTWYGSYSLSAAPAGGTVTSVTAGVGLANSGTAADPILDFDFAELTDMTGAIAAGTEFILQDGTTESRKAASEINVGVFDNATAEYVSENDSLVVVDWNWVLDEDTLVSDSATHLATQQSIKAYVDSAVASSLTYQGGYNASTNTPDLDTTPSGISVGDTYTVTAAGNFFTEAVQIGDMLIAEQDNPTLLSHWTVVQDNIGPASESTPGYIEIATQAEVDGASDTTRAVVPSYLHNTTFDGGSF